MSSFVSHKPIHFEHLRKKSALNKLQEMEEAKNSKRREIFLKQCFPEFHELIKSRMSGSPVSRAPYSPDQLQQQPHLADSQLDSSSQSASADRSNDSSQQSYHRIRDDSGSDQGFGGVQNLSLRTPNFVIKNNDDVGLVNKSQEKMADSYLFNQQKSQYQGLPP